MTPAGEGVPVPWTSPRLWAVPLLAGIALAVLLDPALNRAAFLAINAAPGTAYPAFWAALTDFGDTLVALALLLFWQRRRPDIVVAVLLASLPATLLSHGLKAYFDAPRPPAVLGAGEFHLIGPGHRSGSFPSGHTTSIFVLAAVLACQVRALTWVMLAILAATLIGLSRSVVGVHWPADVAGGALCGWVSGVLGVRWMQATRFWQAAWVQRGVSLFLLACAGVLLFHYHSGYAEARRFEQAVALLAMLYFWWIKPPADRYSS